MRRKNPPPPPDAPGSARERSLLGRWERTADAGVRGFERDGELDGILEALAATVALEALGALSRTSPTRREALRRAGARALLQVGALLQPGAEDEERAEAVRIVAPFARDGLRALAGKEPPRPPSAVEAAVGDAELVGLVRGSFDGFRLAEIAWRVRESREAQRAVGLLVRLEEERELEESGAGPARPARGGGLRLAADGASSVRDPAVGTRMAELRVGGHDVELFRFEDGVIAAYAGTAVVLRLGGAHVTPLVTRAGYAEARPEGGATRLELDVGGDGALIEL
jgi:hypothetical protein